MRALLVAALNQSGIHTFNQRNLIEARNVRDFLQETGEFSKVQIFSLAKTVGPLKEWAELEEVLR